MNRFDAIQQVVTRILADKLAEAVFLKGSIARGEDDDYSDVDLYIAVDDNDKDEFLKQRLEYLAAYKSLIYWSEVNFVGPQIVGIYEDGLHFDLYTVSKDNLPKVGDIKVLYDPNHLLIAYEPEDLSISLKQAAKYVDESSYTIIEMIAAMNRKDTIWLNHLFQIQFSIISILLRNHFDPSRAQLGSKGIMTVIPDDIQASFVQLIQTYQSSYIEGSTQLVALLDQVFELMPDTIKHQVNLVFYRYTHEQLVSEALKLEEN